MSREYSIGKTYLIFINGKPVAGKLVDISYNYDHDVYKIKAPDGTLYSKIILKS